MRATRYNLRNWLLTLIWNSISQSRDGLPECLYRPSGGTSIDDAAAMSVAIAKSMLEPIMLSLNGHRIIVTWRHSKDQVVDEYYRR